MAERRHTPLRRSARRALAIACAAIAAPRSVSASTLTITTTYTHNADGALTAVSTQPAGQSASAVYLTWDNFTPSSASPATGTVTAGNGNLLGIGARPGVRSQFAYDVRDRLTGCGPADAPAVRYAYDPASLMASSTLESGDALQFYYDHASAPQMVNTRQPSSGALASFLGPIRYVSDGTEQVLLTPRKDVDAAYDPTARTVSAYAYDPYGAASAIGADTGSSLGATVGSAGRPQAGTASYDLTDNPFRYAREYRDPTCRAYYLRARWYLPEFESFLSRDPADPIHRYGYTGGNPVGRVDPTGLHGVEAGAQRFLERLDANQNGPGGIAARFFLGGAIGIAQILANPSGYWHRLTRDAGGMDIFLAAGVAAEIGTSGWGFLPELPGSYRASFAGRHLIDAVLGVGQSVASGFGSRHRFDWSAMAQGVEYTAGGMFEGRELIGIGYKPFSLTADDVTASATAHFTENGTAADILVYRVRSPLFRVRSVNAPQFTSPLLELAHLGVYHETVVGVMRGVADVDDEIGLSSTEASIEPLRIEREQRWIAHRYVEHRAGVAFRAGQRAAFIGTYTGGIAGFVAGYSDHTGDEDFLTRNEIVAYRKQHGQYPPNPYRVFGNNCQNFAARIRGNLGFGE